MFNKMCSRNCVDSVDTIFHCITVICILFVFAILFVLLLIVTFKCRAGR